MSRSASVAGTLLLASCLALPLAACGGTGGGSGPGDAAATPATNAAPSAATTSEVTTPRSSATPTASTAGNATPGAPVPAVTSYALPKGSGPHDVAPAQDGGVWYTAQQAGALGYLDPKTGKTTQIALGAGSAPHGVIVGQDGAAWVTDGGLNAIVRVAPGTHEVTVHRLPANRANANLNTAAFDGRGRLWFTGQSGVYGRLDPATGAMAVFDAPGGRGPYGITSTPGGNVYYASLAGNHIAKIDLETGAATVIRPSTAGQGARRVWADSTGLIWVSEWNSGQVSRYDPAGGTWKTWKLPGTAPHAYAVYVDETDTVWLSEWTANAVVRFDPRTETFTAFPSKGAPGNVRQLLGRPGEVWAPESAADVLTVIRHAPR